MLVIKNKTLGFTLVEILLVIALLTALGGLSFPIYRTVQVNTEGDLFSANVTDLIRRGEVLSQTGYNDSVWSIAIRNDDKEVILYQGNDFENRDTDYDEIVKMPATMEVSGLIDIHFASLTGMPDVYGDITMSLISQHEQTITLNQKGVVFLSE